MKALFFSVFLFIFFPSCKRDKCIDKDAINPNAPCFYYIHYVCGCNGVTYSNECYAKNAGVTSFTEGECK